MGLAILAGCGSGPPRTAAQSGRQGEPGYDATPANEPKGRSENSSPSGLEGEPGYTGNPAEMGTRRPPVEEVVVDSDMTRAEALAGNSFPEAVKLRMELVTVRYHGFDGKMHRGQIVVRRDLAPEVEAIFGEIERSKEPIAKVIPVVRYGWSDERSMADNNTSGFNYRHKHSRSRGSLSRHAYGVAIDINPRLNPDYGRPGGWPWPYRPGQPGVLSSVNPITVAFRKRGWAWGGAWAHNRDLQHFEKP